MTAFIADQTKTEARAQNEHDKAHKNGMPKEDKTHEERSSRTGEWFSYVCRNEPA
jgi:hypothetical protein